MNTLSMAFKKVAYDDTTGIKDHEPLDIKENQGMPTIQRALSNGHEIVLLSDEKASANHEVIVNAFTEALEKSASYFSEKMKQTASTGGLTRAMIKQVFNNINYNTKTAWRVLLLNSFLNPIRETRSQLHELSPDQLLQSQYLPEEFKTEILRHNIEIAVRPANKFVNYLTREVLFRTTVSSELSDQELRGPNSFKEIEQSLQAVARKTESALHLLIDALEQKAYEDSITENDIKEDTVSEGASATQSVIEEEGIIDDVSEVENESDIEEDTVSQGASVTQSVIEEEGITDEVSEVENESDIDDEANIEDEIEEYDINASGHNTASEYFYTSSHAMVNAAQWTGRGCKAKINGREVLAQRCNELAQSYEKKSAYCEKIALEINAQEGTLIMDTLFLAADYFIFIIEARKEAISMASAGDEANTKLWADIANSYEDTITYTDRGVEALKAQHAWLAYHWINAAGTRRVALRAISHEEQQSVVPFLKKAADVALITAECANKAAEEWQNNHDETSDFWTDAGQISDRHFRYREELVSAVRDRDITLILSVKEKCNRAEAYTNLLIEAAQLVEDGKIDQANALKTTGEEIYSDIDPVVFA